MSRTQDLPQPTERERRYLSHAELLRLAKATGRFETLTLVLGYCGPRFGEAVALRRRHVGERELNITASATHVTGKGIVERTTTKTNRSRHVPVPGPVWDRLKNELPEEPNALVFPRQRGEPLPLEEYWRAFNRACAEVGIEGVDAARTTPHHRVIGHIGGR
jgi:integrase